MPIALDAIDYRLSLHLQYSWHFPTYVPSIDLLPLARFLVLHICPPPPCSATHNHIGSLQLCACPPEPLNCRPCTWFGMDYWYRCENDAFFDIILPFIFPLLVSYLYI